VAGRLRIGPRSATDRDGATFDPRFGGVGKQTVRDTIPLTKKRTGTIDVDVGDRAVDYIKWQAGRQPLFLRVNFTGYSTSGSPINRRPILSHF
jgi:arylsulfatase